MKNFLIALIALCSFSICIISCSSSEDDPKDNTLVGTWELVEYCVSPGDISCPYREADFDQSFEFTSNGKFVLTQERGKTKGSYTSDSIKIHFEVEEQIGESTGWGLSNIDFMYYGFTDSNHVSISPQCFEGCDFKYDRK